MKFATIGHLLDEKNIEQFPESWIHGNLVVSPELDVHGTKGYITGLTLTARQMMELPRELVRKHILDAAFFSKMNLVLTLSNLVPLQHQSPMGACGSQNRRNTKDMSITVIVIQRQ